MALTVCEIKWEGTAEYDGPAVKATRVFRVTSSGGTEEIDEYLSAAGVPVVGDAHPIYAGALALKKRVAETGPAVPVTMRKIAVDYTSDFETGTDDEPDPLDWRTRYSGATELLTEYAADDIDGTPLKNKANKPFPDPIAITRSLSVIIATTVHASATWSDIADYGGKINDATYNGIPVHQLLCRSVTFEDFDHDGSIYYRRRVELVHNPRGWALKVPSTGFTNLAGDFQFDGQGNQCPEPSPLNSSGAFASTPFIHEFDIYEETDFSGLGL